ncbi:MAG: glycosyltransferase family 4 protein [Prevotella sp.]|nr:glycosyltransferase family 4 protein [Prevotella sp.]
MKIVYVNDAIARLGGVERVLVEKMNYLAEKYNQEVWLITTCQGNHPLTFSLSDRIKHIDLSVRFHTKYQYSLPKRLYMGWKMDRELKVKLNATVNTIDPDIVIATSYYGADIVCQLKCRAKKIIESHAPKEYVGRRDGVNRNWVSQIYRKWKYRQYFSAIEKKSDAIVSLTTGDAKVWKSKNVVIIPNIVDLQTDAFSGLTCKTALFAGRFLYEKGVSRLLDAWKIIVSERNDWMLKLVGEGEQKEELMEQCKRLGIEKNVIFAGTTKNIAAEYCDASLFLLASRFEGFGLVLVEAMQCGVPCISFDCPYGPADIIDNGNDGILVENGNIKGFAEAVLKLMNDDELRIQMGKAAQMKAKRYLPEMIMPQWIELFNRLVNVE